MKKTFILVLLTAANFVMASTVNYTVDDDTDFWNPERGFYHYSEVNINNNGWGGLDQWSECLNNCGRDNMSLLFRYFNLKNYNQGQTLSQNALDMIAGDFAAARQRGVKVIVRFNYGNDGYNGDDNWSFTEPTKAQMQAHMAQIKPILAANADVIAVVQAGFVGIWGEWYFTSTFGKDWSKPNAVNDRNDLINSLLDMTPADRFVQLRTVHYITEYMGSGNRSYTGLTDQTAFSGSAQSRLGHHNDAFCTSYDNWGTYYDYDKERPYLANLSQYVPIGGESAGGDYDYYKGSKALADMEYLHYDYINTDYEDKNVIPTWKRETKDGMSYYDIMKRRLGYRFQLTSATISDEAAPGGTFNVKLSIKNAGFSNLYNKRIAYIVLKGNNKTYKLPLKSDPRFWKCGQTTSISENLTLPSDISAGTYNIYLNLPDMYSSIANQKAYAIQLANKNMAWTLDGMNDLGMTIVIKKDASQGGGQEEQGGEDEDTSHDYATSIDFMALAAQYAASGSQSTNGIQEALDAYNYSIVSVSDGEVYWDNQSGPDGGLGIDNPGVLHDLSFWVRANYKVTITVGSLNGDGNPDNGTPNTATITMNGGTPTTIDANTTTEYTTTEPTLFVLSTLPAGVDWSWNRIHQITIEALPSPISTLHSQSSSAPASQKFLHKEHLYMHYNGRVYNVLGF